MQAFKMTLKSDMWCEGTLGAPNFIWYLYTIFLIVDIRLKAGNSTTDGRVEVFFNGLWGTVCATNWDLRDAEVVCQMLGYGHALRATSVKRHAGDKTPIWLDRVQCRGIERNIVSCSYQYLSVTQCSHKMEAWVTCNALAQGLCC